MFKGYSPAGKLIKAWLHQKWLNPIQVRFSMLKHCSLKTYHCTSQSAFSIHFVQYRFNVYDMLVPDLMHEFDLGVWKGMFIHLMCLLHAQGHTVVKEFDQWYVSLCI